MKRLVPILLCVLLPLCAACAEPQVTVLPTLPPDVCVAVNPYVMDLTEYYTDVVDVQCPCLTDDEQVRVPALLARYADGERPVQSVLNKSENVVVGVYALDAAQYQGGRAFVLLPARALMDEELLELIDGYARLGLPFDADGLSWRNCMRGGAMDSTREYMGDERERVRILTDLYKRQGLRAEQPLMPLPSNGVLGVIGTDASAYACLREFLFRPCRRMTDEELLAQIQHKLGEDIPDSERMRRYEALTRERLTALLGAPLSLKRIAESVTTTEEGELYTSGYEPISIDATPFVYWAELDVQTGRLVWADAQPAEYEALPPDDLRGDPNDAKWLRIARDAVSALRADGTQIVNAKAMGEIEPKEDVFCIHVCVTMADGSCYYLLIAYQTEAIYNMNYWQTADAPERNGRSTEG